MSLREHGGSVQEAQGPVMTEAPVHPSSDVRVRKVRRRSPAAGRDGAPAGEAAHQSRVLSGHRIRAEAANGDRTGTPGDAGGTGERREDQDQGQEGRDGTPPIVPPIGGETAVGGEGEERPTHRAVPIADLRRNFAARTREMDETGVPIAITVKNVVNAYLVPYEARAREDEGEVSRHSVGELNHMASNVLDEIVETGNDTEITDWNVPKYRISLTARDTGGYERTTESTVDNLYQHTAETLGSITAEVPLDIPYDNEQVFRFTLIESEEGDFTSESTDVFRNNTSAHVKNARASGRRILLTKRKEGAYWVIPVETSANEDHTVHGMRALTRYPQLVVGGVAETKIPSLITRDNIPTAWIVPPEEGEVIPLDATVRTITDVVTGAAGIINRAVSGPEGQTIYLTRNQELIAKVLPHADELERRREQQIDNLMDILFQEGDQ